MMLTVVKPFKTALQRFAEGAKVAEDADLSPHTVESLVDAGYIEKPAAKSKARSAS